MIAGPHGAGKSSIMERTVGKRMIAGRLVDPQKVFEDLRSHYEESEFRKIPKKDYATRAFERAFTLRFEHIRKRKDLTALCSMGAIADLDLIDAARQNGYRVALYFFGVNNWKICRNYIKRTKDHWLSGLSDEDIYGDYHRAIAMLPGAIIQAQTGVIYDHSDLEQPRPLLEIEDGRIKVIEPNLPNWILEPLSRCL